MPEVEAAFGPDGLAEAVLRDCLADFPHVRLRVTGDCMVPALDPGDVVLVASPARRRPRWGDIVLVLHPEGLRLHRLVWGPPLTLGQRWRTKGDRSPRFDPPLQPAEVLGTVIGAERHGGPPHRSWFTVSIRSLWGGIAARVSDLMPGRAA